MIENQHIKDKEILKLLQISDDELSCDFSNCIAEMYQAGYNALMSYLIQLESDDIDFATNLLRDHTEEALFEASVPKAKREQAWALVSFIGAATKFDYRPSFMELPNH